MKVTNQNALPIPGSLLTALRDIERSPADSMEDMQRIAEVQANTLRSALFGPIHQLPDYVSKMFPSITVEHVTDVPIDVFSASLIRMAGLLQARTGMSR